MKRRRRTKSHPSHERWLVSYADFITLMFAFFVVMYSTAQVDKKKVGELAQAIQAAFQKLGVFPANSSQVPITAAMPMPISAIENPKPPEPVGTIVNPEKDLLGNAENGDLGPLRKELQQALQEEISRREVDLRTVPDGLVISLREVGFFESGSAAVRSNSQPAFGRIVSLLSPLRYRLRIEGHTDPVPIHNAQFASNWELSTARATELVRILITDHGFAPERLSAAGFAEYHPIAGNDTADGRAQNRRVDVVVLGKVPMN